MVAHILRYAFGIGFLVLGVAGLFLPVLQGILFLVVGLLILAPESRPIRRQIARIETRFPRVFARARGTARSACRRVIPGFGGREETCDGLGDTSEDTVFTDEDGRGDAG